MVCNRSPAGRGNCSHTQNVAIVFFLPQVCGGNISGMFGFFFCEGPVTCFADATKSDTEKFAKWHRMMLQKAPGEKNAGSKRVGSKRV